MALKKSQITLSAVVLCALTGASVYAFGVYDAARATQAERGDACRLARWAIERAAHSKPLFPLPFAPRGLLRQSAPCFVTLSYQDRRHGCTGSFDAHGRSLADNIVQTAVRAWRLDPRSKPLSPVQLKQARVFVTIPGPYKRVSDPSAYPPANYGLLVRAKGRSAVLLPGEARTGRWQMAQAKREAGLSADAKVEFCIFRAVTWAEEPRKSSR
ncbi:MAG: AMMECR1 domain-containing protein [Armatimonadetes bacterium]|nr:AMMECR1 domain-containing protein [Armatimonadota bacterium]